MPVTYLTIASSTWRLSVLPPLTCVALDNARAIVGCRAAVAAGTNEADGHVEYVYVYNSMLHRLRFNGLVSAFLFSFSFTFLSIVSFLSLHLSFLLCFFPCIRVHLQ